nr:hypothetical protein [uncultured Roseibium sp.]
MRHAIMRFRPLRRFERGSVLFNCVAATWVAVFWAGSAAACSFHNYVPARTVVDWVLTGQAAVLARPDPENRFSYKVTQVLRGDAGIEAPPFLIDSATRAKLVQNPNDTVLFGLNAAGSWVRIAYVKEDYRTALDEVVAKARAWRDQDYHPERIELFSEYLGHPDRELSKLALLEIDRAPYALLRQLKPKVPVAYLTDLLRSREGYAYRPIVALLLGLHRSAEAKSFIRDFVDRSVDWEWAEHLGAFATALIEQDGINGIARLEPFLTDPGQPLEKLESIVEAMAIHHGAGTPAIREAVFDVLTAFARKRPGGSVLIARQFSQRRNWAFGASLEPLLQTSGNLPSGSKLVVAAYVAQSRVNRGQTEQHKSPVQ